MSNKLKPIENENVIITSFILALVLVARQNHMPAAAPATAFASFGHNRRKTQTTDAEYPASIQGTVDVEIRPQVSGN